MENNDDEYFIKEYYLQNLDCENLFLNMERTSIAQIKLCLKALLKRRNI